MQPTVWLIPCGVFCDSWWLFSNCWPRRFHKQAAVGSGIFATYLSVARANAVFLEKDPRRADVLGEVKVWGSASLYVIIVCQWQLQQMRTAWRAAGNHPNDTGRLASSRRSRRSVSLCRATTMTSHSCSIREFVVPSLHPPFPTNREQQRRRWIRNTSNERLPAGCKRYARVHAQKQKRTNKKALVTFFSIQKSSRLKEGLVICNERIIAIMQ